MRWMISHHHHHHQIVNSWRKVMSPPASELSLKFGVSRASFTASAYAKASSASIFPFPYVSGLNDKEAPKAVCPASAAIQSRANGSQLPSAVTYELLGSVAAESILVA